MAPRTRRHRSLSARVPRLAAACCHPGETPRHLHINEALRHTPRPDSLNDLYREAAALGIELKGVRVIAGSGFDTATWRSTGIDYSVEVSSDAPADQLSHLLEVVDQVAEIPQAIRAGATVRRVS